VLEHQRHALSIRELQQCRLDPVCKLISLNLCGGGSRLIGRRVSVLIIGCQAQMPAALVLATQMI
jgi:hypothetical protein